MNPGIHWISRGKKRLSRRKQIEKGKVSESENSASFKPSYWVYFLNIHSRVASKISPEWKCFETIHVSIFSNFSNFLFLVFDNKNRGVHKMRLPRPHFLFIFFRQMDGQIDGSTFWCQSWIVLYCLLVHVKFHCHRSIGNYVFRRWKITRNRRTDGRIRPLIEMRSRI